MCFSFFLSLYSRWECVFSITNSVTKLKLKESTQFTPTSTSAHENRNTNKMFVFMFLAWEESLWLAFYVCCLTYGFIEPFGWWFRFSVSIYLFGVFFILFYLHRALTHTNIRLENYQWMHFSCKSITVDDAIYFKIECECSR